MFFSLGNLCADVLFKCEYFYLFVQTGSVAKCHCIHCRLHSLQNNCGLAFPDGVQTTPFS